jgi:DNA-directed RNA polymerase specialized sigma24 family protein
MEHKRAEELVEKNEAMKFLSGMIHRSFHSATSPYHKIYRQSGRVHELYDKTLAHRQVEDYDQDTDLTIEAIQGLLEEMLAEGVDQWFRATLFKMWLNESNYSELSRVTKIPRTTISQAVKECREYIQQTLKQRGIE